MPGSTEKYLKEVALWLRSKEAERARGNPAALEELELTNDSTLLRKWSWISAMSGAAFSFLILPLLLGLLHSLLPEIVDKFLWAIAKVCMGLSLLMFLTSFYFTVIFRAD